MKRLYKIIYSIEIKKEKCVGKLKWIHYPLFVVYSRLSLSMGQNIEPKNQREIFYYIWLSLRENRIIKKLKEVVDSSPILKTARYFVDIFLNSVVSTVIIQGTFVKSVNWYHYCTTWIDRHVALCEYYSKDKIIRWRN